MIFHCIHNSVSTDETISKFAMYSLKFTFIDQTLFTSGEKITKRRKRKASVMQESMEPYKCQHCSEEFDVLSLLNEHLKEKHEVI